MIGIDVMVRYPKWTGTFDTDTRFKMSSTTTLLIFKQYRMDQIPTRDCALCSWIYHNNKDERDEIAGCLQETRVNVIEECHRLLPCDYECKGDSLAKYEQRSRSDVLASLVKDVTQVHISKNPWPFGRTGERHKGTLHGKRMLTESVQHEKNGPDVRLRGYGGKDVHID